MAFQYSKIIRTIGVVNLCNCRSLETIVPNEMKNEINKDDFLKMKEEKITIILYPRKFVGTDGQIDLLQNYSKRSFALKNNKKNSTALRNHLRIVFEDMSSWTAFTMYIDL